LTTKDQDQAIFAASDIVERLRWCRWREQESGKYTDTYDTAGVEAERLEAAADIERLRRALMTRLEDLLPAGTEAEWSCGHVTGAMCKECYRLLAARAHKLAEENLRLREELEELRARLTRR
jgi:hypothetical protein